MVYQIHTENTRDSAHESSSSSLVFFSLLFFSTVDANEFNCVEVEIFQVDRSTIESKQDKRAATIPEESLQKLQDAVALEVPLGIQGATGARVGRESCPDATRAVIFGGVVSDFKPGSRALRYFVGFGAGAQKFAVDVYLKVKSTGEVLATGEVIDRKIGGLLGGEADKGVDDFSEKAVGFIKKSLR